MDDNARNTMHSKVWILRGLRNEPAMLMLDGGRLRLDTAERRVFDVPLEGVEVAFPRLQFDGGCRVRIGDEAHKIAFVRPNGAADLPAHALVRITGGIGGLGAAIGKVRDIGEGRTAGRRWKAAFEQTA